MSDTYNNDAYNVVTAAKLTALSAYWHRKADELTPTINDLTVKREAYRHVAVSLTEAADGINELGGK